MNLGLSKISILICCLFLQSCSTFNETTLTINSESQINRDISSVSSSDKVTPVRADWEILTTRININGLPYTPFFVRGDRFTFYSGGYGGGVKQNYALKLEVELSKINQPPRQKVTIKEGPNFPIYSYFRAPRVAKNGNELWMLMEVSGCYKGCDTTENPKSLAVYVSTNDGDDWTFLDFVKVDGKRYVSQWNAHTGLVYNSLGSSQIDLNNLTNNRFVTLGENQDLLVSADGINYHKVKINHPFEKDRFIFASLVKTKYGYHIASSANWNDRYFTTTVRHLFSKDLVNWYAIESNSFLKNPKFYKGVHLSYDEATDRLWAISPCGIADFCSIAAAMKARDFLSPTTQSTTEKVLKPGEYVDVGGKSAMIIKHQPSEAGSAYDVLFSNGEYKSGVKKDLMQFPLSGYQRKGCLKSVWNEICIGDPVFANNKYGSIIGIKNGLLNTKYAIRFNNGEVVINYYSWAFQRL